MQLVRTLFGAQNVDGREPGLDVRRRGRSTRRCRCPTTASSSSSFALLVLLACWLLLKRTRLGLFVRGVTQNRPMARCMGVPHRARRYLPSRWARASPAWPVSRCQPDRQRRSRPGPGLHRRLLHGGGARRRRPARRHRLVRRWAWASPTSSSKAGAGAVLAKIVVLVFIIIFIQKRPQGIFALKGRSAENEALIAELGTQLTVQLPAEATPDRSSACAGRAVRVLGLHCAARAEPGRAGRHPLHVSTYYGHPDRQDHVLRHRWRWRWT